MVNVFRLANSIMAWLNIMSAVSTSSSLSEPRNACQDRNKLNSTDFEVAIISKTFPEISDELNCLPLLQNFKEKGKQNKKAAKTIDQKRSNLVRCLTRPLCRGEEDSPSILGTLSLRLKFFQLNSGLQLKICAFPSILLSFIPLTAQRA